MEDTDIDVAQEEQTSTSDYLSMSDEEFMAAMEPDFNQPGETEDASAAEEEPDTEEVDIVDEDEELQEETDTEEDTTEEVAVVEDIDTPEDMEDSVTEEEALEEDTDESDYKAQVEKILAPFKANGKEIKVDSVDDAITLMKMGANYNKKMQALKPNLKILRMLENQSLLDEEKLNYLIDLSKGNAGAIGKLVKESGVDPLEIDSDSEYVPENHRVDEREMAIDEVLDSIKETDTYAATVDVVSNQWDRASRDVVIQNPQIIRLINDHKANGIFDQIMTEIERDKMFGRLDGLSDIEAYRQVGDRLYAEGKFGSTEQTPNANEVKPKAVKQKPNPQTTARKKAAASTKAKPAQQKPADFNPLAMSDEEFEKLTANFNF